jgi:tRNA pseudouridine55 synthase
MGVLKILPGTGRGTMRSMVEQARHKRSAQPHPPSTTPLRVAVPLPTSGEDL